MTNSLQLASLFVLQFLFDLFIVFFILRLLFQYLGVNFYNPIAQFIVKMTRPVMPLFQKWFPTYKKIDFAVIFLILLLECIKFFLIVLIKFNAWPNVLGLLIWGVGDLIDQVLSLLFFALLIQIILSWVKPSNYSPIYEILDKLTSPLLTLFQRIIPPIAGIDLSPIPAILLIKLLEIMISIPLIEMGLKMALS